MNLKTLAAALTLCASAPVMAATCTSTFSMGTLDSDSFRILANTFYSAQSFRDCYNFTLSEAADASGLTIEFDASRRLDIALEFLSLTGGNLLSAVTEPGPGAYSFGALAAGVYQLALVGEVTDKQYDRVDFGVGYVGKLVTGPASVVTPVPEPEALAMLAIGFAGVVWGARRRKA